MEKMKDQLEPGFVLEYLRFLTALNDKNNIRAELEKALRTLPSDKCKASTCCSFLKTG